MSDERDLVERLRRLDNRAWTLVIETYRDRLYGFCLRMLNNRIDAEDAIQDAFMQAVKGIRNFRGEAKLSTWLFEITKNLVYSKLSAARRRGVEVDDSWLEGIVGPGPDGEVAVYSGQSRAALEKAISALEPEFRAVIILREIEGLSYSEIAELHAIPIDTVKSRIHRGRLKLMAMLGDYRP